MKKPIHIITPEAGPLGNKYMIAHLSAHWQAWGYPVTVGPLERLRDGIGLLHVDQTRVPAGLLPAVTDNRSLLNGRVLDISKKSFSPLRLLPQDSWGGPVIVKSDLNCYGQPEHIRRMAKNTHPELLARLQRSLDRFHRRAARISWQLAHRLPHNEYPVLANMSQIPDWVWNHEELIVERFLPERVGDAYSIRGWLFFGERGYAYRLYSNSPVVKAGNISHFDILDSVPQELQALRREYGFDFGKFDYVEVDGRAVLIDINKTPTTVAKQDSPRLRDLAEGIHDFPGMGN